MYKKRHNKLEQIEAVALSYDQQQDFAPKVIAKGKGDIAANILKIAEENKIPVQKDEAMLEVLSQLEINESIPEELYGVVAELFAFLYKMEKEAEKSGEKTI